ncbi:hypothetical protein RTM1035_09299 [Roseovarius sp. TM1035]|uniref:DUF2059 domain-containing protein n=1 Tax=Roseovarius TaxID=74030 RepID=UPI0001556B3B|nr:DUF2059 domain-containing protein [Roseovarius sp. TM1035]AWZ21925.1 Hypothetical protein RAK1035_3218 [Roseovarius sp. AK1035]EDM32119.1 hypothetical protein RTM1035_09299 [Roseovarius sp. TM1035]|tara:strand:+ start:2178 stop:3023 length:846 start_codon:yes stop_codon:yes gene_type:complete
MSEVRLRSPARGVVLTVLAVVMVALIAGPLRAADRARLEAFLEVTGFGVALDSIALSASGAPAMLGLSASDFGQGWSTLADEVFETARMREMGLSILEEAMDDEMLGHAAEFYASDLGQRLVLVENAAHLHEDDDAKRAEGEALLAAMPPERVEVLRAMNAAVDSAGTGVRAVQEIQVRFLLAASYAGVLESEIDETMLRALLAEDEDELRESLRASALASAAYTYQSLPIEDLRAYVAALEHPIMARVYELMNAVQYEIMANRFEVLAARMRGLTPAQEL